MSTDMPVKLASLIELKSAVKLVPPEEQPKPPEPKPDTRPESKLQYGCCIGHFFVDDGGRSFQGSNSDENIEFIKSHRLTIPGGLDNCGVPGWVRAAVELSNESAPK